MNDLLTLTQLGMDTTIAPDAWRTKLAHEVPYSTTPGFPPKKVPEQLELPLEPKLKGYNQWPDAIRHDIAIYDEDELAAALGVTANTLGQWRAKNYGPRHIKLGKGVFYKMADVREWVAGQ
jgi:predicted DNA-binding transcriptional regulator AlpA